MKTEEKARLAARLREDEGFQFFIEEFRNDCIAVFTDSTASETEKREEAHAHLRAISKLLSTLDAAEAAQALDERKALRHGSQNGRRDR